MKGSWNVCVVSKESWWDMRRARKHLLYEALAASDDVESILYANASRLWWRPPPSVHAHEAPEKMEVFTPWLVFPGERFEWVRRLNRLLVKWQVGRRWRREGKKLMFFYNPRDVDVAVGFGHEALIVFDWTEDWADFYRNESLRPLQDRAVREADAVVAVTHALAARARDLRADRRVLWLPNASALSPESDHAPHQELKDIACPRIGFVGHLGPWFDARMVRGIAEAAPAWSFVCIGGVGKEAEAELKGVDNVHCLGTHPLREIPSFMAGFDVCIAPYKDGFSGDASKFYDYLTSGKPIVTSPIPGLDRFGESLYVADGVAQWCAQIGRALAESPDKKTKRLSMARLHTWKHRAEELLSWLSGMGG